MGRQTHPLHLLKQQWDVIDALWDDGRCLMHPQSLAQSAIYLQIWANGEGKSGKSLVLCQPGSQGTPRVYSSRRRRSDPLYLGRAVTTGPHTRGRSLSWGVWTGSVQPWNHAPAWQERLPQCGTACSGVRHAHLLCTSCASPWWSLPTAITLRPAHDWRGRRVCPPAAHGTAARSGVRRPRHVLLQHA